MAKLRQYCYLLADLTPERLAAEAGGDYERMRDFLRWGGGGGEGGSSRLARHCTLSMPCTACQQAPVQRAMRVRASPSVPGPCPLPRPWLAANARSQHQITAAAPCMHAQHAALGAAQ